MRLALLTLIAVFATNSIAEPIVIAHRGASGYLPEHTLAAKAMAVAQGADYVEQDVVMTKDSQLIVLHDLYLDRVSDVAKKFPGRHRNDGRFYVVDFTLAEIRTLQLSEVFETNGGKQQAIYSNRFPLWKSNFKVHTLAEEIELIQGLNRSMNKDVGIYPEIKSPWFFRKEGKDISLAVLETLKTYGYTKKDSKVYLQSFDANELRRIRFELLPKLKMEISLIQLVAHTDWHETKVFKENRWQVYSYDWMFEKSGLQLIKSYADGIGPWYPMLVTTNDKGFGYQVSPWAVQAKEIGLLVHAYTFRADRNQVPKQFESFGQYVEFFHQSVELDGFFTDFPDQVIKQLTVDDANN